jgi:ATP-dependent Clp protease ATP-binding subunit ClpA
MFDMFTPEAQAVVITAQDEAQRRGDVHLGTEHLLLGLLEQEPAKGLLAERQVTADAVRTAITEIAGPPPGPEEQREALAAMGVDLEAVRAGMASNLGSSALAVPPTPFDDGAKLALQAAVAEAGRLGHDQVGPEHELFGVLSVSDALGVSVLRHLGVDTEALASSAL